MSEMAIFRQPTGRTPHSCHSRMPTIWCLIRTMRRVRSSAMLTAAVLGLVLSASASPCPSQNTATKSSSKPVPTKQTSPTGKGQSDPCETAPSGAESQPQEVSWDPVSCWDCSTRGEVTAFFLLGSAVSAPIFLVIRRVRTRKRESAAQHRLLE